METFLVPRKWDKYGPAYHVDDVVKEVYGLINAESYFYGRVATMSSDVEKAEKKVNQMTESYGQTLDKFYAMEQKLLEQTKKVSSSVRDSSEKLSQGLLKIEKTANFDRLERYVELLEKASAAMTTLAKLEAEGKLEKIAGALK